MLDITKDIESLTNFKGNTREYLERIKESGHPLVLTVNGKAEVVVQDKANIVFVFLWLMKEKKFKSS